MHIFINFFICRFIWRAGGFGLYVHWPFCEAKCPYCDFNSHVVASIDHDRWLKAYIRDLSRLAEDIPDRVLNSIFFGGGTPSLMRPETIEAVISSALSHWSPANDLEITLEANPSSVEAERFHAYRSAGVNRISIGIQSLNENDLKRLGRIHSVAEGRKAISVAQELFERVSFDLIYARQNQTPEDWEAELKEALSFGTDHLSLYQLTIEDGTAFGDRYKRGSLRGLPSEDTASELFEVTQDICSSAGLQRYEVSNHARPGAESRHNLIYWNYGDYAGIGPGAHGRITTQAGRFATEEVRQPSAWLQAVENQTPEKPRLLLSSDDQATEFLLMGLRLRDGVDIRRYKALSGKDLPDQKLSMLLEEGLVSLDQSQLRTTTRGTAVLNGILAELLS